MFSKNSHENQHWLLFMASTTPIAINSCCCCLHGSMWRCQEGKKTGYFRSNKMRFHFLRLPGPNTVRSGVTRRFSSTIIHDLPRSHNASKHARPHSCIKPTGFRRVFSIYSIFSIYGGPNIFNQNKYAPRYLWLVTTTAFLFPGFYPRFYT